jgi:hypothetical protein
MAASEASTAKSSRSVAGRQAQIRHSEWRRARRSCSDGFALAPHRDPCGGRGSAEHASRPVFSQTVLERRGTASEAAVRASRARPLPACSLSSSVKGSAAVTALSLPAVTPFFHGDGCDDECGCRVGPPEAPHGVEQQAREKRDREVGAKLVLARLGNGRR